MNPRLRTPLRIAAWATSGVIGLGIAAGAANAVVSHGSAATPTAATAAGPTGARGQDGMAGRMGRLGKLKRFEHGQATFQGKSGPVTMAAQRGAMQNVSDNSIEVRSADGFDQTYVIDSNTKIRSAKQQIKATDIPSNAQVLVIAYQDNNKWTARRIVVLPAGKNTSTSTGNATQSSATNNA